MAKRSVVCIFILSVLLSSASAQSRIFIVRHAERADASQDSELSEAGRARAESLAKMLKDKNITTIYATEFKRTQETGAPLAKALGIKITVRPAKATDFALKLRAEHGNALVVGHSNTIPDLIKELGISQPVKIGENDYDDLFEVVLGKKPKLIHTHYH
jgi:broad specificity phosphatase PhoE